MLLPHGSGECWNCSITQRSIQPSPPSHTCPGKQTSSAALPPPQISSTATSLGAVVQLALGSSSYFGLIFSLWTKISSVWASKTQWCLGVSEEMNTKAKQCGWGELSPPPSAPLLHVVSDTITSAESIKQVVDGCDLDQGDFPVPKWLYCQVTVACLLLDSLPKSEDCCLMGKITGQELIIGMRKVFPFTDHIWQAIQLKICHCHFSSIHSERIVLH